MTKCRYCGKEYEGGLWDDGFCCGRCRAQAKKNKITGKIPNGCLIIIGAVFAFLLIGSQIDSCTHPKENNSKQKVERTNDDGTRSGHRRHSRQEKVDEQNTEQSKTSSEMKENAVSSEETTIPSEETSKPEPTTSEQESNSTESTTQETQTE